MNDKWLNECSKNVFTIGQHIPEKCQDCEDEGCKKWVRIVAADNRRRGCVQVIRTVENGEREV